ncbi:MAG TPA: hypothetical protein VNK81_06615 [Thermodesulfobacteriota bacterium]|jgi:hypothetical protein|nr:hypothetical protein [Thermodesulfobacteriota bacterium]
MPIESTRRIERAVAIKGKEKRNRSSSKGEKSGSRKKEPKKEPRRIDIVV